MIRRWSLFICTLAVVSAAHAVPQQINYQGTLTRPTGAALDTTVAMAFRLYTDSTGGTQLWSETRPSVAVVRGLFNARLGQLTTLADAVLNQPQLWLGITVGSNSEMTPRTRIVSTAYSYRVGTVDGASGGTIGSDVNITGKANIGSGNTNAGTLSFVSGLSNAADGEYSVVSGGYGNSAVQTYATVSGGNQNTASQQDATVSGGASNNASGQYATVGGGDGNAASGGGSTVGGGSANQASESHAVVSGGQQNTAAGYGAAVGGGYGNSASNDFAAISGGESNTAGGQFSNVSGGKYNTAHGGFATVAGGGGLNPADSNSAFGEYSAIGGGNRNYASGFIAAIGGGSHNLASGLRSFVGGGGLNAARGDYSVIAGGGGTLPEDSNTANWNHGTISGGRDNHIAEDFGTVGGGETNSAGAWCTVGGGNGNRAWGNNSAVGGGLTNSALGASCAVGGGYGNIASGPYACVPGGYQNCALGGSCFAAGSHARSNFDGCFVWGSSLDGDSTVPFNTFSVTFRSPNGTRFYTTSSGTGSGVYLSGGGGSWQNLCDARKKNFHGEVNTSEVLQKVAALPLRQWSYKSQDDKIQHIGPTAQDFHAAFGLGESDTTINTLDPDGVALAAIQELAKRMGELEIENHALRSAVQKLESERQSSQR